MDNIKLKDPYVMKLVKAYDEKMQTLASGMLVLSREVVMVAVEVEVGGDDMLLLLLWRRHAAAAAVAAGAAVQ